jgi:hypothetical protein
VGCHEVAGGAAVSPALERSLVLAQLICENAVLLPREIVQPLENFGFVLLPRQLTLVTFGLLPGVDLVLGAVTLPRLVAAAARDRQPNSSVATSTIFRPYGRRLSGTMPRKSRSISSPQNRNRPKTTLPPAP